MQMGESLPDAEALCLKVLNDRMRRNGQGDGHFDYDDALGHLRVELWVLYTRFDGRGTFLGYASSRLPNRLEDYYRAWLGRSEPKPLALAVSLDALTRPSGAHSEGHYTGPEVSAADERGLGIVVGSGALDSDEHRPADLLRAVAARGSRLARVAGGTGGRPPETAQGRDQRTRAAGG